ncbi:Nre family DNA repair protein [Candidatus Nanohalobium constans]|uniref:DNA repair protein n=1 Tax=Candidatus Nanohalobium constans TaxID=2565781 RepID=A0A5Q0UGU5_9ARCH|nr:Nre family DNA repair protein [Candidatus Nanohalobium constans]QGA80175.1 DNA repair protein NreA [Candidatus Nanohalobium constans]
MGYGKLAKGVSEKEAKRKLERVMPSSNRKKHFQGKTPSIFVGSHNYPKVNTGILSPQHLANPEMMDSPKNWYSEGFSIEKVASLRTSLVNSKKKFKVDEKDNFLSHTQEVAMARKPVDVEVELEKKPGANISGGRVKPVSASGNVEEFILGENPSVERKVEKMFYDTDAKAETAVKELHGKGIDNYKIQQSFTAGMLGEESSRELVPTRWSITATDDIISKNIRDKTIKDYQELGQIEYYNNEYMGNEFHIFLIPGRWEYELMELKRPGSVWNAAANTYIAQNYESYSGRTDYAEETAGAFYATRLGIMEHLRSRKRQAKALVIREVKPEYWAPLGVWVIRETVRNSFNDGEIVENFENVKFRIGNQFKFLYNRIKNKSKILEGRQTSLQSF